VVVRLPYEVKYGDAHHGCQGVAQRFFALPHIVT